MSLDAALEAAKRGWAVFPVVFDKGQKVPTVPWRHWATTDVPTLVAEWSGRNYPAAGIECEKSGLIVVDEDTLGDFRRLADELGAVIPNTYTVKTGRVGGGRQSYFTNPTGLRSTTLRKQGYNIDIKGAGGYVVAAGSGHPSGATYQGENTLEPAPFPAWLVDYLDEQPQPQHLDRPGPGLARGERHPRRPVPGRHAPRRRVDAAHPFRVEGSHPRLVGRDRRQNRADQAGAVDGPRL